MATEKTPVPDKPKPAQPVKDVSRVTRDMVAGRRGSYATR